jgi:tetratricopeptide (TPR) repeat protein
MEPLPQTEPDFEVALLQARDALLQSRYPEAEQLAAACVRQQPGNREALYALAVAQRMQTRIPEALATLAELEAWHPAFPRLHQERGHCHIFRRDAQAAIDAFERAIQLSPALPASWTALQTLYRMVGRHQESTIAGEHVKKLASLPPAIVAARAMLADGNLREAEDTIRPYLQANPRDMEGMRILANIARQNDFANDAEILLEAVLKAAPDYQAARYDYVQALVDVHKHQKAREEVEKLMRAEPENAGARVSHASILFSLGELEEAIQRYREIAKQLPADPELQQSLGHALKTLGRQDEAVAAYRQAIQLRPTFGEAYWSLANLKTYRFTDSELQEMRALAARPVLPAVDRYHVAFALAKALEDRGEAEESFHYYAVGNALRREEARFKMDPIARTAQRHRELCTPAFFQERAGWGCPDASPIFILGLPRAGSTLLEQILASHSQVEGTMELADIPRLVGSLGGRDSFDESGYPAILADLTPEQCREFGEAYIRDTQAYRSTGKPFFIDKMPNNFRHIALLHLILPNAKIIDARREPMDCCFSNFKQLFASGQQFTYGLDDIGHYYRLYVELMDHWDQVLPGRVLRVQHEEVLADLEGSVRRILDYCGLPFEEGCVEFHKNTRKVHTASSEQVRRPINRDGVGQWRPYESWLGPLKEALGPLAPQG